MPTDGLSPGAGAKVPGLGGPTRAEQRLGAVLEAMVPPGGPFDEGATDLVTIEEIDSFISGTGSFTPRTLRLGLSLLDISPLLLPPYRMRRFSRLPLEERVRLLDAWEVSRITPRRVLIHALKQLVMMHFYSRPEIMAHLDYPQPLERVPRRTGDGE